MNALELGISMEEIDILLAHKWTDPAGESARAALLALKFRLETARSRREYLKKNPHAEEVAHVTKGENP